MIAALIIGSFLAFTLILWWMCGGECEPPPKREPREVHLVPRWKDDK